MELLKITENLWPHNRNTGKIDYDYYEKLPSVPLDDDLPQYIKCWPIDGDETEKVNPYEEKEDLGLDYMLVEVWSGYFQSKFSVHARRDSVHYKAVPTSFSFDFAAVS